MSGDGSHRIMPHEKDGRFYNHADEKRGSIFLRSTLMYCFGWRMRNSGLQELANWHQHTNDTLIQPDGSPHITWIGHASFLIQLGTYTILTDPVFNHLTFLFRRIQEPGIPRDGLPKIDAVIISHNHRDHMERETLQYLAKKNPACTFFVPQGDKRWFTTWGIENVVELNWWQDYQISHAERAPLRLIFLPAHHWSQRSLFDVNLSLWGSWMIEHAQTRIYFAGDTAYSKHFEAIADEFSKIDCVLMPIGPCEPNTWLKTSHINAEEAGKAFLELNGTLMIPMHWGTYKFGMDRPMIPIERLMTWWNKEKEMIKKNISLSPLKIGQSILLDPQKS